MAFHADSMGFFGLPGKQGPNKERVMPEWVTAMRDAGVRLVHITCVPPLAAFTPTSACLAEHQRFREHLLAAGGGKVKIITTSADIRALQDDELGVILGLQQPPTFGGLWRTIAAENETAFYHSDIRVTTLAYSGMTPYGGGFASYASISDLGVSFIDQCAESGMIVDLSHANDTTVSQVLYRACSYNMLGFGSGRAMLMASHSACNAVHSHLRNMPDHLMTSIAQGGGYVGIPTVTFFLGKDDSPDHFVAHVKHALNVCGEDAVGIGSDGCYQNIPLAEARAHYEKMCAQLGDGEQFGARFPDHHPLLITNGTERMANLDAWLDMAGIQESVREKVLGTNFRDFLLRALPES